MAGNSNSGNRKRTRHTPAREFIRVWQTSGSAREAAERLGLDATSVRARAHRMRNAGIPLVVFNARGEGGVRELADFAQSLADKEEKADG